MGHYIEINTVLQNGMEWIVSWDIVIRIFTWAFAEIFPEGRQFFFKGEPWSASKTGKDTLNPGKAPPPKNFKLLNPGEAVCI